MNVLLLLYIKRHYIRENFIHLFCVDILMVENNNNNCTFAIALPTITQNTIYLQTLSVCLFRFLYIPIWLYISRLLFNQLK